MSQDAAIDYNSQAVSPDTLVSIDDDAGKYEVQLGEEGQYVEPKDIPKDDIVKDPPLAPRKRTALVSRYLTLMTAWGPQQLAWEDDARTSLVITAGANELHFADNANNLNPVGVISGIGVGHLFANQSVVLPDYTGPLFVSSDTDSSPVSVVAVTVQK